MAKTREDYEEAILKIHDELRSAKPDTQLHKNITTRLDTQLDGWYTKLDIVVFVANNEQLPWNESEIGFKTRPMMTKEECGLQQVGDYQFFINGKKQFAMCFGGALVERKTCSDFYGTLINRDSRLRFYREIERYYQDHRFTSMTVMVECDMLEFLNYRPHGGDPLINQKMGAVASLMARGVGVMFCGSRAAASKMYGFMVKQWVLKNYMEVIV